MIGRIYRCERCGADFTTKKSRPKELCDDCLLALLPPIELSWEIGVKNTRQTKLDKYLAVQTLKDNGLSNIHIAELFNVNVNTIWRASIDPT